MTLGFVCLPFSYLGLTLLLFLGPTVSVITIRLPWAVMFAENAWIASGVTTLKLGIPFVCANVLSAVSTEY